MKELEQIKGIGSETRKALEGAGVETLAQLSRENAEALEERLGNVSLAQIEGWIEQAATLAHQSVQAIIAHRPLYRLLDNLAKGGRIIRRNTLNELPWCTPDDIGRLTDRGAIAPVSSPPLEFLPGWDERARLLRAIGITTILDLRNVINDHAVAEALGVARDVFAGWQNEAMRWIEPPKDEG